MEIKPRTAALIALISVLVIATYTLITIIHDPDIRTVIPITAGIFLSSLLCVAYYKATHKSNKGNTKENTKYTLDTFSRWRLPAIAGGLLLGRIAIEYLEKTTVDMLATLVATVMVTFLGFIALVTIRDEKS